MFSISSRGQAYLPSSLDDRCSGSESVWWPGVAVVVGLGRSGRVTWDWWGPTSTVEDAPSSPPSLSVAREELILLVGLTVPARQ